MQSINNIGEGIALTGVVIAIAMTGNYWFLLLLILPIVTWKTISTKIRDKYNDYIWKIKELEIVKLGEEVRLLKLRKK